MTMAREVKHQDGLQTLAARCMTHLQREAELLDEARQVLTQVREALLARHPQRLIAVTERQSAMQRAVQQMAARRQLLRRSMANELGLAPEDVSISRLAARLPVEQADTLFREASRVAEMAHGVDRIVRGNAALIQMQVELFQQLLACLTGQPTSPPRYDALGTVESGQPGPTFEARC